MHYKDPRDCAVEFEYLKFTDNSKNPDHAEITSENIYTKDHPQTENVYQNVDTKVHISDL